MKKFLAVAAVIAACGLSAYAEDVKSGLDKGARVPAFYVTDVTGPLKGEELCYRCRYGNRPVVSIFAKEMTDEVAALTKEVDQVVGKNRDQKMAGFVVVMTTDAAKTKPALEEVAKKHSIEQVPLTTFDGTNGPEGYNINTKADVTVMMWVDGKVTASHAFNKGGLTKEAISKVVGETKSILE